MGEGKAKVSPKNRYSLIVLCLSIVEVRIESKHKPTHETQRNWNWGTSSLPAPVPAGDPPWPEIPQLPPPRFLARNWISRPISPPESL